MNTQERLKKALEAVQNQKPAETQDFTAQVPDIKEATAELTPTQKRKQERDALAKRCGCW